MLKSIARLPLLGALVGAVMLSPACAMAAARGTRLATPCHRRTARVEFMEQQLLELVTDTSSFRREQRDSLGISPGSSSDVVLVQLDSICLVARGMVATYTPSDSRSLESVAVFRLGATRYFVWDPRMAASGRDRGFFFDASLSTLVSKITF